MSHEIEPCPVCGMKAHVEYIHKLERELHEANERARVAEANDEASRVASATEWLIVQDKEREISRLTAEVDEWKKKAENALTESAHAHGMAEMLGYRNGNLELALSTLRRSSVRVDVLLRWMRRYSSKNLKQYSGKCVTYDSAVAMALGWTAVDALLTRRSSRP